MAKKPDEVAEKPARMPARPLAKAQLDLDEEWSGEEHRKFPRAKIGVAFHLTIGDASDLRFSASLSSVNLSVSGAFLASTFFLPMQTELMVSFQLDEHEVPVTARAEVVRHETVDRTGRGRDGFAIRFTEFFGQTEVTLAKLFLGEKLRSFATVYMGSKRAQSLKTEFDRVVDALAAWELLKVTSSENLWGPFHPG